MGSSVRQPLIPNQSIPGPGAYQYKPSLGDGPKIYMGEKGKQSASMEFPGPGAYQPNDSAILKSPPKPTLKSGVSRMHKNTSSQKDNPGPGSYKISSSEGAPKYGFGSGQRGKMEPTISPGPGAYKVPCTIQAEPQYLLPNKNQEFKFV